MDNTKKTLKSPLSAKYALYKADLEELKAKAAGEAQKSMAKEVLSYITRIEYMSDFFFSELKELKKLIKEILK